MRYLLIYPDVVKNFNFEKNQGFDFYALNYAEDSRYKDFDYDLIGWYCEQDDVLSYIEKFTSHKNIIDDLKSKSKIHASKESDYEIDYRFNIDKDLSLPDDKYKIINFGSNLVAIAEAQDNFYLVKDNLFFRRKMSTFYFPKTNFFNSIQNKNSLLRENFKSIKFLLEHDLQSSTDDSDFLKELLILKDSYDIFK